VRPGWSPKISTHGSDRTEKVGPSVEAAHAVGRIYHGVIERQGTELPTIYHGTDSWRRVTHIRISGDEYSVLFFRVDLHLDFSKNLFTLLILRQKVCIDYMSKTSPAYGPTDMMAVKNEGHRQKLRTTFIRSQDPTIFLLIIGTRPARCRALQCHRDIYCPTICSNS
jgi:hypothetical protein